MIRFSFLVFCVVSNMVYSQTIIPAKAPNSYIYDLDLANSNNYGGIKIPVIKAYEMWSNYEYLKSNGASNPIPAGQQSASIYWEDVPGLVDNATIEAGSNPAVVAHRKDFWSSTSISNLVLPHPVLPME